MKTERSPIDSVSRVKGFAILFRDILSKTLFEAFILFSNDLKEEGVTFKGIHILFGKVSSIQADILDKEVQHLFLLQNSKTMRL